VVAVLRLVRVPRRWSALVAIPVLVLFVFATGGRSAAVRSLVMAGIWLIGWVLVRPTDLLNSLAAAGLVILAWDPMQLFDGGFVLSFAAVLSLAVLTPPIEKWLSLWPRSDPFLPNALAPRWQQSLMTPKRWLVRVISSSLAAWIGLLPLMAWYFHLFTPISILANVVVIPLLGVITALGMGAMAAHAVWPWLTLTFNNANFFLLNAMIHTVAWLERIPLGYQFVQAPSLWLVAAYYALGVLLLTRRISWPRRKLTAAIGAAVVVAVALIASWPENAVQITVLNLTDGAAVFINTRGEGDDWLIDGGGDWSGSREVVPFLRAQGVDRLSAIVLTRGDKAHAAGLCDVAGQIPIGRAIHGGTGSRSRFFWEWLEVARAAHIPISTMRAEDETTIGDGLRVRTLNPPRGSSFDRSDDNAIVMLLESGSAKVLLMSDAGSTVEHQLVGSGQDLHAEIIIKGQHSAETSCTDEFLDAVRPAVVVQSAGTRPSTRYPQPELRDRLHRRGIRFYRTDEAGAVIIRTSKDGYTIRTCLSSNDSS
jgi:competence protein ComEC